MNSKSRQLKIKDLSAPKSEETALVELSNEEFVELSSEELMGVLGGVAAAVKGYNPDKIPFVPISGFECDVEV